MLAYSSGVSCRIGLGHRRGHQLEEIANRRACHLASNLRPVVLSRAVARRAGLLKLLRPRAPDST